MRSPRSRPSRIWPLCWRASIYPTQPAACSLTSALTRILLTPARSLLSPLLGDSPDVAKNEAQTIMKIETALAKASLTRVQQRDPHNLFHKMDRKQLQALTPGFDWNTYLKTAGIDQVNIFNVTEPEFYKELDHQLQENSLDDIKAYLRWHVASANATYLSSKFVKENFD